MAPAKCIDKNDDDVPVSILRVRTVGPDSRLRRASKKRGLSITDPSRTVKRAAVGYKAAKEGAEFIKAEIKGQQNMRNRAPVARQCAEYVLEQIQAVPDHVWFAEPARYPCHESFVQLCRAEHILQVLLCDSKS